MVSEVVPVCAGTLVRRATNPAPYALRLAFCFLVLTGARAPRLPFDAPSRRTSRGLPETCGMSFSASEPMARTPLAAPEAGALPVHRHFALSSLLFGSDG